MRRFLLFGFLLFCATASVAQHRPLPASFFSGAQQAPFPGQPGGVNGQAQCNGNGLMAACPDISDLNSLVTLADTAFKGANPWIDIRVYGARSVNTGTVPAIPGITATINSTQTTATLSSASTFQNGDGVTVFGAGTAHAMSTPGAPTVSPGVAQAGTGTGLVAAGLTGSTTYNYQVIARNTAGGLTAASAVGSTSIGAATLGSQSVAISTLSRSGTTVTAMTSSAHGLVPGAMVYINSTNSDGTGLATFEGWFVVVSTADNTHFTYVTSFDTASGASTSTTGGTAVWFNCNHVSWTAVTGAFTYYIYGRTGGSLTLLGVSKAGDTYWDDFGSPMMDSFTGPYYVPTTPPGSATSNNLTTTIASGAGTTTLTLANAASTSVSGATILFDNGPTILAAANAAHSNGTNPIYIPGGTFVINSYTTLPGPIGVLQAGDLFLNDTLQWSAGSQWNGKSIPQGHSGYSFAFESLPAVNVNRANPGIYGNGVNSSAFRGISIAGFPNNVVGALFEGGGTEENSFESVNFVTGILNGAADYMGQALVIRLSNNFFNNFRDVSFLSGPNQVNGASATPIFQCRGCGKTTLSHVAVSRRGFFFEFSTAGAFWRWEHSRDQGGITPYLTVFNGVTSGIGGAISLDDIELDTMAHPLVTNLDVTGGGFGGTLSVKNSNFPSSGGPAGAVPSFSGLAFNFVESDIGYSGQNINLVSSESGNFTNRSVQVGGTRGSMGYSMSAPLAPISAVVSAGGAVPTNNNGYAIVAIDLFGNSSSIGSIIPVTITPGNQTITITPPSTLPAGTVGIQFYRCAGTNCGLTGTGTGACGPYAAGTVFVDTIAPSNACAIPTLGLALASGVGGAGSETTSLNLVNSGFKSTFDFPNPLTANRLIHVPNSGGTLAFTDLAQTWTATQTLNNASQLRFLSTNGTNYAGFQGGASTSNLIWLFPTTDSSGTQCLSSNGSLQLSWSACSGGTGTPGGANTQVQYNASGSFGGSADLTWGVGGLIQLTLGRNNSATSAPGLVVSNSGASGAAVTVQNPSATSAYNFNLPTGAGTTGQPLQSGGGGSSPMTFGTLGFVGGGTNQTTFTANQLVTDSSGSLASLAGTLTGTNPVLTLTAGSASAVPLTLNTASTPTGDIFDLQVNGVKTSWFDSAAFLHVPQTTYTGTGGLSLSANEATCPVTPQAGVDILCIGNSVTHTIQSSLNGQSYKDNTQWNNSGPTAHGVAIVGITFPQITSTSAGTTGQPLCSNGASTDPAFCNLTVGGGGTGDTTLTAHSVLLGEGTSAIASVGPSATANLPLINQVGADPIYGALPLSDTTTSGTLPIDRGGTGAVSFSAAGILTPTGSITVGHCAQWSASTVLQDSGGTCGGAGGNPPLHTITAATASNTINSTINPQIWNWALTGSTTAFRFGENTAATGASNILLQAETLSASTAIPFQTDNNGNGYRLGTTGLWQPVGTGALATPGSAHNLVVSQAGSAAVTYVPTVAAGKVLIDNGPGVDPSFQDPIVSLAFVNLWTSQDVTTTRTSAAVRNPIFSQTGTLQLTWASITGSPASCTLQIQGVDSQGNALNNGSTFSVSPSNGTTSQTFTAAAGLQTAAQVKAIFACVTYPSTGTLTLDFTPIPNVNVTNTVTTNPPANASTNLAQVAGTTTDTNSGNKSAGTIRVVIATDQPQLTNKLLVTPDSVALPANQSVNVSQINGNTTSTSASGTQKVGITGNAGAAMDAAGQNAASPANELLVGCQFNTSPTTISTTNMSPLQCTSAARLIVDGSGVTQPISAASLPLPTGAATSANQPPQLADNGQASATNRLGNLIGIYRTDYHGGTAATAGRDAAPDVGTDGLLHTTSLPDLSLKRYKASSKFAGSSTTDNWRISGNASNTVIVTKLNVTCTQTTAGIVTLELRKESAATSGGTATTVTNLPVDSNKAAASSVVQSFTGTGPTVGTLVADIDNAQFGCNASATAGPNDIYIPPVAPGSPIAVLRGTAEGLAINFGGAITGGTLTVTAEWLEVTTITP